MTSLRLEALQSLADYIALAIPDLAGHICVGQSEPGHALEMPSLAIDPVRWKYHPEQAEQLENKGFDRVVMEVGRDEGTIQLRLLAATTGERAELEQRILNLFREPELSPGVLTTLVTACESEVGEFTAAWELEDDEWEDEAVFDGRAWSLISVTGTIPALVLRGESYPMENLQVALEEGSSTETVRVNEDGTITAV